MRRAVMIWLVAAVLAIAAGVGVVALLNATTFGPSAFVRIYLDAISRGDAAGALGMPGVTVASDLRPELLTDDALSGLTAVREVSVEAGTDGTLNVTYSWLTPDGPGSGTFAVERVGSRFGMFAEWGFAQSPVAELSLIVEHDERFDVNGVAATSGIAAADPVGFAVLVPGAYVVDHHSTFLRADAVTVLVDRPGSRVAATLDVQPAAVLLERVTREVNEQLDECATEDVLFPSACALGYVVSNRVASTPVWSIVEYPDLTIEPGAEFGAWLVPGSPFEAHLVVDIQNLFDGSVSTFDDDLTFEARYLVTILGDDVTLRVIAVFDD